MPDGGVAAEEDLTALREAARNGNVSAQMELGGRLIVGDGVPLEPGEGVRLVQAAAGQGEAEALNLLATLTASGAWVQQSWPAAMSLLVQAAEAGHGDARTQLTLIAGDRALAAAAKAGTATGGDIWRRLAASADLERFVQPPQPEQICESPRVWKAPGFATPEECDWYVNRGRDKLRPAKMYDTRDKVVRFNAIRNNSEFFFRIVDAGVLLALLRIRISLLISLPVMHMEPPQLLHYKPGQELRAHYDLLRGDITAYDESVPPGNDRLVTFLLYLNEEYEGGQTHFILADLKHRGKKGDAVFFANLRDGRADRMSVHSGTAVESGEKWLMSQWVHDRPFSANYA